MFKGIAVLLKYKIKNNEICCSQINIRQVTKIIFNFVVHFIKLFKNNRKKYIYYNNLFQLYYNTEVRRNNEPVLLFNCFPLHQYYYIIFIGTYQ